MGDYPSNWPEISYTVKSECNWRCERCDHPHAPTEGYTLTVHHLDHNPSNCERSNLAALCQRCHLHFQQPTMKTPIYLLSQAAIFDCAELWLLKHYTPGGALSTTA